MFFFSFFWFYLLFLFIHCSFTLVFHSFSCPWIWVWMCNQHWFYCLLFVVFWSSFFTGAVFVSLYHITRCVYWVRTLLLLFLVFDQHFFFHFSSFSSNFSWKSMWKNGCRRYYVYNLSLIHLTLYFSCHTSPPPSFVLLFRRLRNNCRWLRANQVDFRNGFVL